MKNIRHRVLDEITQLKVDINTNLHLSSDELISIGRMVVDEEINEWEDQIRKCELVLKYINELERENE